MKILLLDDITTLDILKIFQDLYLMPLWDDRNLEFLLL